MQTFFDSGKYKLVRFNGHKYTATIGSPTGVIAKDGIYNYGRGGDGDYLLVHVDDIEKAPTIFTILAKGSAAYREAMQKYRLTETVTPSVQKLEAVKAETKVAQKKEEATLVKEEIEEDEIDDERFVEEVEEEEEPLAEQRFALPKEQNEEEAIKFLTRDNAMKLADFRDEYGFGHHMQVLAKVRSGELFSYKDDDDTYIYHIQ